MSTTIPRDIASNQSRDAFDEAQARTFFRKALPDPESGCLELRAIDANWQGATIGRPQEGGFRAVYVGYFAEEDKFIDCCRKCVDVNVFVTVNPCKPELRARSSNRMKRLPNAAKDEDIASLRCVRIDIDSNRPSGISASDSELQAAIDLRDQILDCEPEIRASSWAGCSGNGGMILIYFEERPNDDENRRVFAELPKRLAQKYKSDGAHVDPDTGNPSRGIPVPGMRKCKGDEIEGRPYRLTTVDFDERDLIPFDPHAWLAKNPPKDLPKATLPRPAAQGTDSTEAYALKAFHSELDAVANAGEGGRNHQLNTSSFNVGQLVGAGAIDETVAISQLVGAAKSSSSPLPDREIEATVRRGVADGIKQPRDLSHVVAQATPLRKAVGSVESSIIASTPKPGPNLRLMQEDDEELEQVEIVDRWPVLPPQAWHGVVNEIVRKAEPHSEADPVAILVQILVAVSNLMGRDAYWQAGATRHYLNLFCVLVGMTAVGRKGSSWDVARYFLQKIDPVWADTRIAGGLVSGEGLIHHVRDPLWEEQAIKETRGPNKGMVTGQEKVLVDAGVTDKRILVLENEFTRPLKALNRDNNTLSEVVRQAWDSGKLGSMAKHSKDRATDAHVSIIGHVTQVDILRYLGDTEYANGFGNRFLWIASRRSKALPDGGDLDSVDFSPEIDWVTNAVECSRGCQKMGRDQEAATIWREIYEELSAGKTGAIGGLLSRAESQTMRIACVYALLDGSRTVRKEHLLAALSLWEYCEATVKMVFGNPLEENPEEKLLARIRDSENGLTRTEISREVFGKHQTAKQIAHLIEGLLTKGLIHSESQPSAGGRPAVRWKFGRASQ